MARALIIGASGTIGSRLVHELDSGPDGLDLRVSSSRPEAVQRWRDEGRDSVLLDLDRPESFAEALTGVDRVFLLTGYSASMLYQSKTLIDAAADAGVEHLIHLGVYTSRRDLVPHYTWHDLIETYMAASGIAWTNLHPNSIIESTLDTTPPITDTGSFSVNHGEAPQGWVSADDIAAVAAMVLREGPERHGNSDYWLSAEILTGPEVAEVLTHTLGTPISCDVQQPSYLAEIVKTIPDAGTRLYLESGVEKMRRAVSGELPGELTGRDDIEKVLGRPPMTIRTWAGKRLHPQP
ncbi:NAD-dependent epimerase/dehydratase family protein [Brevibacterium permense]|uniref:SDR family oxidoreductase n=1 Tax=Brevibacterium permense TaxID=234834 RepID=UPI0021CED5A6|nr:NmrA family NAD(P)-binding protein [Brevibacterium permense]MCU4297163.1 NAD-dependent epimerase/dehydratase family protein [Brevibacterium permense]